MNQDNISKSIQSRNVSVNNLLTLWENKRPLSPYCKKKVIFTRHQNDLTALCRKRPAYSLNPMNTVLLGFFSFMIHWPLLLPCEWLSDVCQEHRCRHHTLHQSQSHMESLFSEPFVSRPHRDQITLLQNNIFALHQVSVNPTFTNCDI